MGECEGRWVWDGSGFEGIMNFKKRRKGESCMIYVVEGRMGE